ncbi:hypothetical protein [Actinoplanes palleronii]|uniref:Uncharacterized protein n=1 Tax=Actinoplanes palleronii TaxID=113570 RepID=A0ABQ4BH72_9ACTN|nr:hypothetical protein [Actinoplanes palleronii]GIE70025.1 hypothetical protein Apa02nite_061330 [Actinoplanes palleronii]
MVAQTPHPPFHKSTAFVALITAIITLVSTMASQPLWGDLRDRLTGNEPGIEFSSPEPGPVPHEITLTGKLRNQPDDKILWFVTLDFDDGNVYHPSDRPCIPAQDGNFRCPYWIGDKNHPAGTVKHFRIIAILADDATRYAFAEYNNDILKDGKRLGMKELPKTKEELDHIDVQRV